MTVQPEADPPSAETGADQRDPTTEPTENMGAFSEITGHGVEKRE